MPKTRSQGQQPTDATPELVQQDHPPNSPFFLPDPIVGSSGNVPTDTFDHLQSLVAEIKRLQNEIRRLQEGSVLPPLSDINGSLVPHSAEPKVLPPEPFNGKTVDLPNFLAQLQLVFMSQPSRFPTE